MIISTRGRYALRVMIDLAENCNGKYIPMKEVAARQKISLKYLEQILPVLTKNGLVEATHGKCGGYRLNIDPAKCTVGMILRLTEGERAVVTCLSSEGECDRQADCRTRDFWCGLNDTINKYIDSYTLADMMKK